MESRYGGLEVDIGRFSIGLFQTAVVLVVFGVASEGTETSGLCPKISDTRLDGEWSVFHLKIGEIKSQQPETSDVPIRALEFCAPWSGAQRGFECSRSAV